MSQDKGVQAAAELLSSVLASGLAAKLSAIASARGVSLRAPEEIRTTKAHRQSSRSLNVPLPTVFIFVNGPSRRLNNGSLHVDLFIPFQLEAIVPPSQPRDADAEEAANLYAQAMAEVIERAKFEGGLWDNATGTGFTAVSGMGEASDFIVTGDPSMFRVGAIQFQATYQTRRWY